VNAHYSIKGRVELSAGTTLLPKKPEWSEELVWQGAGLGARIGFGKRWAAYLRGAGGPIVDQAGWWYAGAAGVQARKSIHETIVFQGSVGGLGSRLDFDGPGNKAWLVEIGATGEIIFRTPGNEVAFWLGSQFHFPVGSGPDDALDPETRVSFHLGTVLAYVPKWDIVFEVVINDRGDVMEAGSTLPVLDGGFDQTQVSFSIARRFGKDEYSRNKDREIHLAR
jgi:hypothetical protein